MTAHLVQDPVAVHRVVVPAAVQDQRVVRSDADGTEPGSDLRRGGEITSEVVPQETLPRLYDGPRDMAVAVVVDVRLVQELDYRDRRIIEMLREPIGRDERGGGQGVGLV